MNIDEPLRAGKVLSDFCKCGHLKDEHWVCNEIIKCTKKGCNCIINFG